MPYNDIAGDEWFAKAVEASTALGLVSGYPDGTFQPDKPITRAEFASALVRLANNDLALRKWASLRLRAQCAPAIVHLNGGDKVGSGVVVWPDGTLLTCHHVVDGATAITCSWPEWGPGTHATPFVDVLATAPEWDLAVCKIFWGYAPGFPFLELATTPPEPAEPVVMLGSPAGIPGWESYGLVARPEMYAQFWKEAQEVIPVSGAVNPGNSGGALVRASDGKLLGIVNGKLVDVALEGMAFAVPIGYGAQLLQRVGTS